MRQKYLLIDTVTSPESAQLKLLDDSFSVQKEIKAGTKKLFGILKKTGLKGISGLLVVKGPGEFGVVRQGIVFANTLAWALNKKIKGITIGEKIGSTHKWEKGIVQPIYARPPNITKSK